MNCLDLVPADLHKFYEFREWRNPCAVLSVAYPDEWANIISILSDFRILRTDIGEVGTKGGGKSLVAIRMDKMFKAKGWEEKRFDTRIVVNDQPIDSPTHGVDCFKGKVALGACRAIQLSLLTKLQEIFVSCSTSALRT